VPRLETVEDVVQHAGSAVSVRNSVRKPISPRDARVIDPRPAVPWLTICTRPLAQREQLVTTPRNSSGTSTIPLPRLVHLAADQTRHDLRLAHGELETLSAQHLDEYRELQLTRPCTSQVSGRSVVKRRIETFPTSSASRRFLRSLAVTWSLRPDSGEVLMPMVMPRLGSSTMRTGSGRGSSDPRASRRW